MFCVGSIADGAEAIEGGCTGRRGEIAVGGTAHRARLEFWK
jgi:hypothetical protein